MRPADFVSVENADTGYAVTVWAQDGEHHVVATWASRDAAQRACDRIGDALGTWPGWGAPLEMPGGDARARSTDRETSHAAALSVDNMNKRQRDVYAALGRYGPCTHEDLIDVLGGQFHFGIVAQQTDQSVRSRCAELVDAGLVKPHDRDGRTRNNRAATRWVVT